MNKIGLILEGGANRGIFTAGVLDYFMEQGLYLPYVVSVSVGSCNAMSYVSKQIGRTKSCMIPGKRNIPPIHWKHIKNKKILINLDLVFDEYPNHLVPFDYETYFTSPIICEYVVSNCLTGKNEYISEQKDRKRLMEICKASCSMPYISRMIKLNEIPYLDGGISDAIPIDHAMSLGYEKNIVILTRERGYRKKVSKKSHLLNQLFYKKYPKLIEMLDSRQTRYNKIMDDLEQMEKEGKVLIIQPLKVLAGRMDNDQTHLELFYQQGYFLAKDRFEEIKNFIYLSEKGEKYETK